MTTISGHTTRATGTVLTASIYNTDHVVHVTNAQNLNSTKLEGATPPVADGDAVVFDGTTGAALRTAGYAPGDMMGSSNLSDVSDAATSFDAIKQDATDSYAGVVEKATAEEISAGTADKYISADLIGTASANVALTDGTNIDLDWSTGINFTVTLGGNRTLNLPSNGIAGTWRTVLITQDGTGSRTLAFASGYLAPSGDAPVLTTTAGATDRLAIFCRTSSLFEVYSLGFDVKAV
jgi:hypothetical protein